MRPSRVFPVPSVLLGLAPLVLASGLDAQGFHLDWMPTQREVILNTSSTTITPIGSPPITVQGGVFLLRNVTIPAGVTVRGVGPNPLVFIVAGDFRVDGLLTVNGSDGQRVNTLNAANFPTPGGAPGPAGGRGGAGSPNSTMRSFVGESGSGAYGVPAVGGRGGRLSCTASCNRGSGGGGGVFTTTGDPYYPPNALPGQSWLQITGNGGAGCLTRTLPGGQPGLTPFVDGRSDNDFWGMGVDLNRRIVIAGELPGLRGGQGGGGGGDRAPRCTTLDPQFAADNKGGGGGGGGGALAIGAAGRIVVGASGRIQANGGNGGGGEQAGGNNQGAGGGGGSGGMLVLLSQREIELTVKGETYGNNDFDFVLSADGGIGTQGVFGGGAVITGKYQNGRPGNPSWGNLPNGGFGGLGLIQLMTPPGRNQDGTNTVLDDGIKLVDPSGQVLTGSEKQRFLAWRGYPNGGGILVDDSGVPTNIGDNAGDLRPTPTLIPVLR